MWVFYFHLGCKSWVFPTSNTFTQFSSFFPYEYLSISQNVKFSDLSMAGPLESLQMIPIAGLIQIGSVIAAIELYELLYMHEPTMIDERFRSGRLTGDLGFNPLRVKVTDRRRLVELQNGRAAMFAIVAWISADAIPGSVPLFLPW